MYRLSEMLLLQPLIHNNQCASCAKAFEIIYGGRAIGIDSSSFVALRSIVVLILIDPIKIVALDLYRPHRLSKRYLKLNHFVWDAPSHLLLF